MAEKTNKKVIKLIDVDVNNLLAYFNNADIKETQVIVFTKDKITCRAFPNDKSPK